MKLMYTAPDRELIILNLDNFSIEGFTKQINEDQIVHQVVAVNNATGIHYILYQGENHTLIIQNLFKKMVSGFKFIDFNSILEEINNIKANKGE